MKLKAPAGLGRCGSELWRGLTEGFTLQPHELTLLERAARLADVIDGLEQTIRREGSVVPDPATGASKPHPIAGELRQQQLVLARLLSGLRIPDEDDQRPQRRPPRGTYR